MTTLQEPGPDVTALSTAPAPPGRDDDDRRSRHRRSRASRRPTAALRRAWRQLTSMRTALLLLFLLALGAVPGSLLPQRGLNPDNVDGYLQAHRTLGPLFDRAGLFDVFAAPWFAAIYLLLFVSLAGCLLPRIRLHTRALRARPPAAPKRLERLPRSTSGTSAATPEDAVAHAAAVLRRERWRVAVDHEPHGALSVAAEKGYLRETGNLLFHVSLLVLLVAIALGSVRGWKATVLVEEGEGFCNTVSQFDTFRPGRFVDATDLPPFCVDVDDFAASYLADGTPRSFDAALRYQADPDAPQRTHDLRVNHPLSVAGTRTYLLGHGYSPKVTITDPSGQVFSDVVSPFLPRDGNFLSEGVIKLPDAQPAQYGFQGVLTPTAPPLGPAVVSLYPAPRNPVLTLVAYKGDLGTSSGTPQSVYELPRRQITNGNLREVGGKALKPGETWTLRDGTTVRFDGVSEWASLQVSRDPGTRPALVAGTLVVLGLLVSLRVRRRRIWLRAVPAGASGAAGRTVLSVGGLARSDAAGSAEEFDRLAAQLVPAEEE